MTDAKMRQHKRPVVNPSWVLESIRDKKLHSYQNYRLYSTLVPSQSTLFNFSNGKTYNPTTKSLSPVYQGVNSPVVSSAVNTGLSEVKTMTKPDYMATSDSNTAPSPTKKDADEILGASLKGPELQTNSKSSLPIGYSDGDYTDGAADDDWFGPRPDLDVNSTWYRENICTGMSNILICIHFYMLYCVAH